MKDRAVLKNRNAVLFILEGLAMATAINMMGPFAQKFTERIGGNSWHVALINSLPPLIAVLFLVPCGILINRIGHKKQVATFLIVFNSVFYGLMVFVFDLPVQIRATAFVIIFGLMNWPQSLYLTTWQSFYSDTIRGKIGNAIYAIRTRYVSFIGVFVVMGTGFLISRASGDEAAVATVYRILFAACFVVLLVQAFLLSKVQERHPGRVKKGEDGFRLSVLKEALTNRHFMVFCLVTFLFYLSWQMFWPIFYIYNSSKEFVGFDEFWLGIMNVCGSTVAFLGMPMWNRILSKRGTGAIMLIGAFALMLNPFLYLVSTNTWWILAINAFVGGTAAAYTLAVFCRTLELVPDNGKTVYIAVFNTLINISGFIAPLIGTWISLQIGIVGTMKFAGFLRIGVMIILILVELEQRYSLRDLIWHLRYTRAKRLYRKRNKGE